MAKGFTRSQARGHPSEKKGEVAISTVTKRPLRGAAKRGAAARQERILPRLAPQAPSVSWQRTTPGGTRYVTTSDPLVVIAALEEIESRGNETLINVEGEIVETSPTRRDRKRRPGSKNVASTGWLDPGDLIGPIGDQPENVEIVVAERCSDLGFIVAGIDRYTVKERL